MINIQDSTISLSGTINNTTVPSLLQQIDTLPDKMMVLDLSGVQVVDSAAVSLLLSLRRKRGHQIRIAGLPDNLRALIQLYDLDDLLCPQAQ